MTEPKSDDTSWKSITHIFSLSKNISKLIRQHPNYAKKYRKGINFMAFAWCVLLVTTLVFQLSLSFALKWTMQGLSDFNLKLFIEGLIAWGTISSITSTLEGLLAHFQIILQTKLLRSSMSILLDYYYDNNTIYYLVTDHNNDIDNPSARIESDVYDWIDGYLNFTVALVMSGAQIIGWLALLMYMHFISIVYLFATIAIFLFIFLAIFGSRLIYLRYMYVKYSARFRSGLFRSEEYSESIAFYNGNKYEKISNYNKMEKFINVFAQMAKWYGLLQISNTIVYRLVKVAPFVVLRKTYFAKKIGLGQMFQVAEAGKNLMVSFALVVAKFPLLASMGSTAQRIDSLINEFIRIDKYNKNVPIIKAYKTPRYTGNRESLQFPVTLTINNSQPKEIFKGIKHGILDDTNGEMCLEVKDLSIFVPNFGNLKKENVLLMYKLSFKCYFNENILITGPSGIGKSSLMRAICGLWKVGDGYINILDKKYTMFIGQRPYLPVLPMDKDSLKYQILYPNIKNEISDNEFDKILAELNLSYLKNFIDLKKEKAMEWNKALSGGEQQRLAFGRILANKPKLVILDESTSALDSINQDIMYKLLNKHKITYISIGHRKGLAKYHQKIIKINKDGSAKILMPDEYHESENSALI